jgi:hypothetical protein
MAKPRFLRRHYPHQVQGVRPTFCADHLSQAAPPHFVFVQDKTGAWEVNESKLQGVCVRRRFISSAFGTNAPQITCA